MLSGVCGRWAPNVWLVHTVMCCKGKIRKKVLRSACEEENAQRLFNIFLHRTHVGMIVFLYTQLNKLLKLSSSVSSSFFDTVAR